MLIKEGLGRILAAHAGIGAIAGTRIYGGKLPQRMAGPTVVYKLHKVVDMPILRNAAISVKSYFWILSVAGGSDSYMSAAQLADQVRRCLNGFAGTITDGASPESLIIIKGIFRVDEEDYFDDPTGTDWVVSDWEITHTVDPLITT